MKKISCFIGKSYWQQDILKREYLLAIVQGAALIFLFSFLFYQSLWLGVLALPLDLVYLRWWQKQCIQKKIRIFQGQFRDAMNSLSTALRTGYAMENAMSEAQKDVELIYGKESRIVRELELMNRQLKMNLPVEQVWEEFAERTNQEDVANFTAVFVIAKRSGGDTITILRNAINQISDKIEVKREIDTVMAEKQLEFKVMSFIPLGIIAYMHISFPEFMSVLYQNVIGTVVMTGCLAAYAGAWYLGRKIIAIEV